VMRRYQTVLFFGLLAASIVMGGVLWHLRERAHEQMLDSEDAAETVEAAPSEQVSLMVANDADNTVTARDLALPLPENPEAQARAMLGKLLDLYAASDATHPVPGGAASVTEVFLLPVSSSGQFNKNAGDSGPQLAVVNLTDAFVSNHPSGLETETLTVLSICATLHANLPNIAQVRFLVDGQPRATLAGHADLTRTYLAAETVPTEGAHP